MPPESSIGKDTGMVMTDRQQSQEPKQIPNIVFLISQFADDNLTLLRSLSTGLAVAGVIIIARSIKLTTRFYAASQIPERFIERNVSLVGKVHSVTEKGLEVEHVPVYLPVISSLFYKRHECPSPLQVHLAGVALTPEGRQWLQNNLLPAKMGLLWTYCVNENLIGLGLAHTAPIPGLLPGSRLYWHLYRRLHRSEVRAQRKGCGLWKEDSLWERASKTFRDNRIVSLIRRLFSRTRGD